MGSIEIELATKRRDADASPEITFERTVRFLIPASGRRPNARPNFQFPITLISAYGGRKKDGYTISLFRVTSAIMNSSRIGSGLSRPPKGYSGTLYYRARAGRGKRRANGKLRSHEY